MSIISTEWTTCVWLEYARHRNFIVRQPRNSAANCTNNPASALRGKVTSLSGSFVTTLYPWLLKLRFNQVLVLRWHNHKAATVRLRWWEECLGSDHPPQLASYPGPALVRDPVKTNSLDEEADYTIAIFYYYHHQDDREEMFICQSLMTRYRGYHQSCAGDNLLFSVSLLVTG